MANGTIAFDTLQTSGQITGTAKSVDTDYVVNGSAKVWSQFDGSSFGLRDSFNVSGITDNGTGDYTVTFNNDMAGASNYSTSGNAGQFSGAAFNDVFCFHKTIAAGSIGVQVIDAGGTIRDQTYVNCIIHGDLA